MCEGKEKLCYVELGNGTELKSTAESSDKEADAPSFFFKKNNKCPPCTLRHRRPCLHARWASCRILAMACRTRSPIFAPLPKLMWNHFLLIRAVLTPPVIAPGKRELDTMRVYRNERKSNTANGKVQTNQEATVIVSDLDLIVAVHLLEDTLPVLSHAQLCEDHG